MAALTEIRWHGRGGQGAKTASFLLAESLIDQGKFAQGFPDYGPEREGAPMRGYTRISDSRISVHSAIYHPDVVIVLDSTLLDAVDVTEGLKEGGTLLVNTPMEPVNGLLPNSPPPRFRSCEVSSRSRQHMLTASSGERSLLT